MYTMICTKSPFFPPFSTSIIPRLPFHLHISSLPIMRLRRAPILGPHIIRKRLGLLVIVRPVAVLLAVAVVRVRVVGRADVLHAVDAAALGAAFDGAVAGHIEPDCDVAVGRVAGAAGELLVAGRVDDDGVVEGAFATSIQWFHVEDVDTLHFAEDFEALEAGGLVEVGGDGARFGAGG